MSSDHPFNDPLLAQNYERWYSTEGRRADHLEKRLLAHLLSDFPNAETMLEIGCGTGHFTRWFTQRGLSATGLDLSTFMLHRAGQDFPINYLLADAHRVPFEDGTFDLTALITTLEFLTHPMQGLAEAFRVSRQGTILGVLNSCSLWGFKHQKSDQAPWKTVHPFTPGELYSLVRQTVDIPVKVKWRTTLFPLFPFGLPLPWGGFIGMSIRFNDGLSLESN